MRKIIIAVSVLAMVCASFAFAVGKEGTSGAKFLNVGVGARAAAMADAYDPIASGPEAIFWNAAGLVTVENQGFSISDNEWIADTRMIGGAYARRFGFGTLGFMVTSMMYGDIDETTTEEPNGTGETFSAMDMAAGVAFGRRLTDRFSVGGTVKLVRCSFSGVDGVDPAMGVAFDVGTQYMTGFRTLRMAIALQNLGPEMQYGGTYEELQRNREEYIQEEYATFSLPVVVRLGVAYDPIENMTLAVNAAHPNDGDETIDVGGEWWPLEMVAIRGGYKVNYDEASYTGGVGLKFGGFRPDFSYTGMGRLGESLKATLGYDF
ncbi:MAG: PorV/PorQ family protein [Candidatus Zixiibacteriota bacterium]|jgi:hypothetical protein